MSTCVDNSQMDTKDSPEEKPPLPKLSECHRNEGWSVEFSRSQNKFYFFHRLSGTSCWNLEDIAARYEEVVQDRNTRIARQNSCGDLTSSSESITPSPRYPSSHSERSQEVESTRPRKRRASADECSNKGRRMSSPARDEAVRWSFDIDSQCFVETRHAAYIYFGPNPRIERYRSLFFNDLKKTLMQGVFKEFNIELQQSSFIRWITEVKAFDTGFDPLLPTAIKQLSSANSLKREILYELPVPLRRPNTVSEATNLVRNFALQSEHYLRKWCDEAKATSMISEMMKILQPLFDEENKANLTSIMDILHLLILNIKPTIDEEATRIIDSICNAVLEKSRQRVSWIQKDFLAQIDNPGFLKKFNESTNGVNPEPLPSSDYLLLPDEPAKILGSELDFAADHRPCGAMLIPREDSMIIKTEDNYHELKMTYFEKLRSLYKLNTPSDSDMVYFPTRLWMLLERYNTYLDCDFTDVNQAALPPSVFECLNKEFGVTHELFASPFNCYFKQYCSAFPDTDCFFGSRGPLQNFFIAQGSFEANPPFTEELLTRVVDFITKRLTECDSSLSVAFFVPDWRDPPVDALQKLENSPFNRAQLTFPAKRHGYRQDRPMNDSCVHTGFRKHGLLPSSHGTTLIFMQNDSGYEKWTPTPSLLKKVREAFFSGM